MIRLICHSCSKHHYVTSIDKFSGCDVCGANLSENVRSLITKADNICTEIHAEQKKAETPYFDVSFI